MRIWEYHSVPLGHYGLSTDATSLQALNDLGGIGWEVVEIVSGEFLLKREKKEKCL